jgi:hypothetical protein
MWRISALLWSAVEWFENHAERRRLQYCIQQRQRREDLPALDRSTVNTKLRTAFAFLFVLIAGRR